MRFKQLKALWTDERTQRALSEFKTLAKTQPKKLLIDTFTACAAGKSFESNIVLGNPTFNELGLHRFRVALAAKLATRRRAVLAHCLSVEDLAAFEQNGFILKENYLSDADFTALKQELLGQRLPTRETLQGDTVTRRMALDARTLPQLPQTQKLLKSAHWQSLINYVGSFKVQPMYYVQVIISHVRKARPDPQTNLHSDTFHPSVKAWLFLNDVEADEGPFVYVPGSHQVTEKRLAWEYQQSMQMSAKSETMSRRGSLRIQAKDLALLGYAEPKAFAVKANTLVIADTYGFHARGPSVRPSTRIELWAYARRSPFLPWVGGNLLGLPLLKDRLIPIYWWVADYLEQQGKRKNPWRKVGALFATDPTQLTQK